MSKYGWTWEVSEEHVHASFVLADRGLIGGCRWVPRQERAALPAVVVHHPMEVEEGQGVLGETD